MDIFMDITALRARVQPESGRENSTVVMLMSGAAKSTFTVLKARPFPLLAVIQDPGS